MEGIIEFGAKSGSRQSCYYTDIMLNIAHSGIYWIYTTFRKLSLQPFSDDTLSVY
jgi:hypothetical protein